MPSTFSGKVVCALPQPSFGKGHMCFAPFARSRKVTCTLSHPRVRQRSHELYSIRAFGKAHMRATFEVSPVSYCVYFWSQSCRRRPCLVLSRQIVDPISELSPPAIDGVESMTLRLRVVSEATRYFRSSERQRLSRAPIQISVANGNEDSDALWQQYRSLQFCSPCFKKSNTHADFQSTQSAYTYMRARVCYTHTRLYDCNATFAWLPSLSQFLKLIKTNNNNQKKWVYVMVSVRAAEANVFVVVAFLYFLETKKSLQLILHCDAKSGDLGLI